MSIKLLIAIFSLLLMSIAANGQEVAKVRWENGFHLVKSDKPFPLTRYPGVDYFDLRSDQPAHCTQAGKNLRICKVLSDTGIDFVFKQKGKRIGKWPTSVLAGSGNSIFEVLKGDLDGDQIDEIIVANLDYISNGMGIQTWTISIFPNPDIFGFQPPLEFSVEEFGARGTFVKHSTDKRCQILVTEWHSLEHPKRGDGMYIIGRWYHYWKGSLIPVKDRPPVARRYLNKFAELVSRTQENPKVPLWWFQDDQTETLNVDPAILEKEIRSINGVISKVIPAGGEEGDGILKIQVRLDSGQTRVYQESAKAFEDTDDYFFRLGSGKFERPYPMDYTPADINKWLLGKKVKITTYGSGDLYTRQIIWLENQ